MHWENPICLPPRLSEVSPMMPLKWCLFNGATNCDSLFNGVTNYGILFSGVTHYGSLFSGVTNYGSHFSSVTNYGRVWRMDARERDLEYGKIQANWMSWGQGGR